MSFLNRLFGRRPPRTAAKVAFDETGVTRTLPNGQTETVAWNDLQRVIILTTADGPLADDVLWLLRGTTGGCLIPSLTAGMDGLLPRLQALPDFDNEAVIRAMGSTEDAQFLCWQRPEGTENKNDTL